MQPKIILVAIIASIATSWSCSALARAHDPQDRLAPNPVLKYKLLTNDARAVGQAMRIGEVAAAAHCNIQTLRYYERRGLLRQPKRTSAGYREYPTDTVRIVRFIKRAQDLGFTLHEIDELLKLRTADSARTGEMPAIARAKMRDIAQKQARLQAMHGALGKLLQSCTNREAGTSCPILDALNDGEEEHHKTAGGMHDNP